MQTPREPRCAARVDLIVRETVMRTTQNIVASTQPAPCPTPSKCPATEEMWACVRGERSHDEIRHLIQHCSFCNTCAERWRTVCEQSLDGGESLTNPNASAQEKGQVPSSPAPVAEKVALFSAAAGLDNHNLKQGPHGGKLDEMAHRYEDESFARPSLVPWAIGAGVILIGLFLWMAS